MADGPLPTEEAENLGVGLAFLPAWDFELIGGSFKVIHGIELLGRDIAFVLQQELDANRGELASIDTQEDIAIDVNRIITNDDRVAESAVEDVSPSEETSRRIEVTVSLTAITGEAAEFLVRV